MTTGILVPPLEHVYGRLPPAKYRPPTDSEDDSDGEEEAKIARSQSQLSDSPILGSPMPGAIVERQFPKPQTPPIAQSQQNPQTQQPKSSVYQGRKVCCLSGCLSCCSTRKLCACILTTITLAGIAGLVFGFAQCRSDHVETLDFSKTCTILYTAGFGLLLVGGIGFFRTCNRDAVESCCSNNDDDDDME